MNDAEIPATDLPDTDADTAHTIDPADVESDPAEDTLAKVRREARNLRDRLKTAEARADELAHRLHTELARANGKLADPHDFPFNPDLLDDTEAMNAAIDALLTHKPHLRSRAPKGDIGQGARGNRSIPLDFSAFLRQP
ncbi:hypothetical protein [Mycobacterium sp. TY814]|uniref:hypothetical protein n=1 Tax=unclassified Mycobacterium TaxID=2642494 RepID=UPI0027416F12|nr:hypothetical protein [Mycobacterium sp. TY814]MDP7725088.1 hypothetical protein [Mycobacterium sp. TY814]